MKINSPTLWKAAGLLGTSLFRQWIGTIDFKWAFYDVEMDPWVTNRHFIFAFWHEHILCPLFIRHHCAVTMMLSGHQDAEVVNQVARLVGMKCIRGSSNKGGAAAAKQFLRLKTTGNVLAVTPDGPQGPARRMAPGVIHMASRLQLPLVLYGVGYDRPWRVNSWDRFVLPRPFSRGRIISSPLMHVPKRLSDEDFEHYRLKMETLLTDLTDMAEDWARSGRRVAGESTVCMGPKCSLTYFGYSRPAEIGPH